MAQLGSGKQHGVCPLAAPRAFANSTIERLLAGVFEYVQPALGAIARVDRAAVVDEAIADTAAALAFRSFRQESRDLLGPERFADVVDPQPGGEPGGDDRVLELGAATSRGSTGLAMS